MSTIIFTDSGTIITSSQLDDYEKKWIQELAEKTDGKMDKAVIENFLLKRDHIVLGGELNDEIE